MCVVTRIMWAMTVCLSGMFKTIYCNVNYYQNDFIKEREESGFKTTIRQSQSYQNIDKPYLLYIDILKSHSGRVVHSASHTDVTSRGWPTLGPFESFPDVRHGRDVDVTSFPRPRRIRTSGKRSYGSNVGRPLNVHGRLAEWDDMRTTYHITS